MPKVDGIGLQTDLYTIEYKVGCFDGLKNTEKR